MSRKSNKLQPGDILFYRKLVYLCITKHNPLAIADTLALKTYKCQTTSLDYTSSFYDPKSKTEKVLKFNDV